MLRPALQPVRRLAPINAPAKPVLALVPRRMATCESLDDALGVIRQQVQGGVAVTLVRLGAVAEAPRMVAHHVLASLGVLATLAPGAALSLRPRALAHDSDLMGEILLRAHDLAVPVQFDSQGPDSATALLACARRMQAIHDQIGVTLPGRWMRSRADADMACELGLRVRVVKGQWADPLRPQFDERAGFLTVVNRLAGKACFVSIATHDATLAREALKRLRDAGTACELELTHGVPQQAAVQVARALGVPVRAYVAYGPACAAAPACGHASQALWAAGRSHPVAAPAAQP
jgi:proline dehydrogenase